MSIADHLWKCLFIPLRDVGTVGVGQAIGGRAVIIDVQVSDNPWPEAFEWVHSLGTRRTAEGFGSVDSLPVVNRGR